MAYSLTDLHTHILPGVDDGAQDLETSLQMLRMEKLSGVDRVALTPHFYPLREEFDAFVDRRQQAYETLLSAWDGETMPELKLGAEVRYSPGLTELDLRQLTIGNSDYMLLELSNTEIPVYIDSVLDIILNQGITPILAHIERCTYFHKKPEMLCSLIRRGALAQVSAKAFQRKNDIKFIFPCLFNGLAHFVASDVHTPQAGNGLGEIAEELDDEVVRRAEGFAKAVWDNDCPPAFAIYDLKRTLFGYR